VEAANLTAARKAAVRLGPCAGKYCARKGTTGGSIVGLENSGVSLSTVRGADHREERELVPHELERRDGGSASLNENSSAAFDLFGSLIETFFQCSFEIKKLVL